LRRGLAASSALRLVGVLDEVLAIISVCGTGLDPAMPVQQVLPFNLSGNITPRA
jgi:hypothetical protein